jgi:ABC-type methionine transport system ATPase subunit
MIETRKVQLQFPLSRISEPVVTRLVMEFDLVPNLLRANVDAHSGGWMVTELTGETENITKAIEWMRSHALTITEV